MRLIGSIRPTTVIALIALIAAGTGTAFAAKAITGATIKNNSITGKDIKKDSLTGQDVKESTLDLPAGPRGAQGPQGAQGVPGADGQDAVSYFATVDSTGTLDEARSSGIASAERTGLGAFRVFLEGPTEGCNAVATATDAGIARIRSITDSGENADSVLVNTYIVVDGSSFPTNEIEDRGFMLQVAC